MSAIRLALLSALLAAGAQRPAQTAPRFLYIYRDSLKAGVDSEYRAIENEGAQLCADFTCPNPYIGLESLRGPHEAWWINAFATEADTARVAQAYASSRALSDALGGIARRKQSLIGKPIQGFALYRPDLSRGPAWPVAGARFLVVVLARSTRPVEGSVWQMGSTLYILHLVRTRREAETLAGTEGRLFAIRPNWSMPAPAWVAADPEFWRGAPMPKTRHQHHPTGKAGWHSTREGTGLHSARAAASRSDCPLAGRASCTSSISTVLSTTRSDQASS